MATLSDIAANLGINKTTVSKALNGSNDISASTCERVIAEAKRVGYIKTGRKRNRLPQKQIVGIICPEITSFYYASLVTELTELLHSKKYKTVVMLSNFAAENEKECLSELIALNVCGVILITEESVISEEVHTLPGIDNMPLVVIGLNCTSREYDTVSVDEDYAIQLITDHLISLGHRSFAFIGDQLVGKRLDYLKNHLERHGISMSPERIVLSDKRNEACGYEGMNRLLAQKELPTAVVAGYDTIALGASRALSEHGLCVPDHLSLVSFDDADFCRYLSRSITTVSYDAAAESKVAVAILLSRIHDGNSTFKQTAAIIPKLIVRESTQSCEQ